MVLAVDICAGIEDDGCFDVGWRSEEAAREEGGKSECEFDFEGVELELYELQGIDI